MTNFSDAMTALYESASIEHEKQYAVNVGFSRLLLDQLKDTLHTLKGTQVCLFETYSGFSYELIESNKQDGILKNIDYSKIPYYLQIDNAKTLRCVRLFVSPIDVSKVYIGCYCIYKPKEGSRVCKNTIGPDEQIVNMKFFNSSSVLFSIGEFLLGESEFIDFATRENSSHLRMH